MAIGDVIAVSNESGTEVFRVDSSGNVTASGTISTTGIDDFGTNGIKADVVAESTSAAGVTIDGTLVKDGGVTLGTGANLTGSTTSSVVVNTIAERSNGSGVTIDGLLVKDSGIVPMYVTGQIGASTAAAGSSTSDAGALPSGALIYPTTAADGTKGVRVHASDKVTGRMLFIGNGVSNQILKVYPPSGGTINGASADAAFSSASGKGVVIVCLDSTGNTWLAW